MTPLLVVMIVAVCISALALAMTLWNLSQLPRANTTPLASPARQRPLVSVCIPARNEQANIEACVRGLLASTHEHVEVLVYDDQSTDQTPSIIASLMRSDVRVRSVPTLALPEGWNGKQHACYRCAQAARGEWLLFTDADVRFEPGAVSAALNACEAGAANGEKLALVSTFPRQETRSLAERLAVPMIFFILLSYLPFVRMRTTKEASSSAGCGQFLFVRSDVYQSFGGHSAFRSTMHDGIKMPRAVRGAGHMTGLFDGTSMVSCRMYFGLRSTWRGFAKNAYEGLGSVGLLVFLTIMHVVGHVLPWLVLALSVAAAASGSALAIRLQTTVANSLVAPMWSVAFVAALVCCVLHVVQRLVLAVRFRTSIAGALLHPFGVLMMTAIQWHSFVLHLRGKREWRGRVGAAAQAS
jgi:hypothetical protein